MGVKNMKRCSEHKFQKVEGSCTRHKQKEGVNLEKGATNKEGTEPYLSKLKKRKIKKPLLLEWYGTPLRCFDLYAIYLTPINTVVMTSKKSTQPFI